MKKSDLKTGMIVVTADGEKSQVLLGTKNGDILSGQTWCPLNVYNENLEYGKSHRHLEVVRGARIDEVYQPEGNMHYQRMEVGPRNLIWERPRKRFSPCEAEKLLEKYTGIPVEIDVICTIKEEE